MHDASLRLNDRMSVLEFSRAYGIPACGVAQLSASGLLPLNHDPIVKALHSGLQLSRSAAVGLAGRLLAARYIPPPDLPLWSLEDVFHGIGVQEKPWGAILQAALKREIKLYCDDLSSDGLNIGCLKIPQSLAHEILASARPELLQVPEISAYLRDVDATRIDVERYLNCFPRDVSWLIAEGYLYPHPRWQEIADVGRRLISSREISWRWRVSPSFREAMAKDRGIRRTVGPFWDRSEVEAYFAQVFPAGRPV